VSRHLEGRPVSTWSYSHHGCRCLECTALATRQVKLSRRRTGRAPSQRAQSKATNAAVMWVKANHPDVWKRLYDEAYLTEVTQ
jgi:hypothetical protein